MVSNLSRPEEINVLANEADWDWPEALSDIFRPRGINLLMAGTLDELVNIIEQRKIHTAIIDIDVQSSTLATIRIIRIDYPLLPCILLTSKAGQETLQEALRLEVFSVIDKPVDMVLLQRQLNKIFTKRYNSSIFGE
ncbi:MAG: response regulator [Sedimentisphaerales bacterium]|nr:response regulator [Sedimentisphaerales bacterium]